MGKRISGSPRGAQCLSRALCVTIVVAASVFAQSPAEKPISPTLNRTDVSAAGLRESDALIEEYLSPVEPQEPTPEQKRQITSVMELIRTRDAEKIRAGIEQVLKVGRAALGVLREAAAAPRAAEARAGGAMVAVLPTDQYCATMANIIIRRIEAATRAPIVQALVGLGVNAQTVLAVKLDDAQTEAAAIHAKVEAAIAAKDAKALEAARAAEQQIQKRLHMLAELRRLLKPPPKPKLPQLAAQFAARPKPRADVLNIRPISPPTGQVFVYSGTPMPVLPVGTPYILLVPPGTVPPTVPPAVGPQPIIIEMQQ